MFTNQQLKKMIVPLFVEQFLVLLVGISDTFMVSYAGEAAVSGVSLVNSFNTIFIYIFTALASGGAVVISQYIGNKDNDKGSEASSQLLMFSTIFSILLTALRTKASSGNWKKAWSSIGTGTGMLRGILHISSRIQAHTLLLKN